MRKILTLACLLFCTIANADDFAFRNRMGGLTVITGAPCNVTQVQVLYIKSEIPIRYAYVTDKQHKIVAQGCWTADFKKDLIEVMWDDWSVVTISANEWSNLDDIALE